MNYKADAKNESSPPLLGGEAPSAGMVDGQASSKPTRETSNDVRVPAGWATATLGAITLPREAANPKALGETLFQYVDIDALDNRSNKITSPKKIKGSDAPSRARMAIRKGDVLFSLVRPYLKNITDGQRAGLLREHLEIHGERPPGQAGCRAAFDGHAQPAL